MSFVIVDAYGFLFRAYHSLPPLTDPKGQNVGAIYGFINMLVRLLNDKNPSHILIALDSGGKTFRHEISPEYKSNRPAPPDELVVQFDLLKQLLIAMQLPHIAIDGIEADDIIASSVTELEALKQQSIIVSSDKDLTQLLTLPNTKMYDAMKRKFIDKDVVIEKYGVAPSQMLDYLSLLGDASDFVPGVKGIGAKGAATMLQKFDSLDGIYQNLDQLTNRQQTLLQEGKQSALLSKQLITLKSDLGLISNLEDYKFKGLKCKSFAQFLDDMGFASIIKKLNLTDLVDKKGQAKGLQLMAPREISLDQINPKFIKSLYHDGQIAIYFDENKFSLTSAQNSIEIALNIQQNLLETTGININDILISLKDIWSDPSLSVICINAKDLYERLKSLKIELNNFDDLNVMSYLINCGKFKHEDNEVLEHNGFEHNANGVFAGFKQLYNDLKQSQTLSFYLAVDRKIPLLILKMEDKGVYINTKTLEDLTAEFSAHLKRIEHEIFKQANEEFNIASPKQLGHVLFEKMQLPAGKKSKTGSFSTNSEILENLANEGYKICSQILEWRHLSKLINTYTRALPQYVNEQSKRLHTKFQLTGTSTGRFSSQDPNLQNIPIRSTEGAKIRAAFAAIEGNILLAADYSQVELRLLANIANITEMKEAIRDGQDIHALTARQLFGDDIDVNNNDIRRKAKAINFGIIYGISAFGLAKRLNIDTKEAKEYIERYFEKFPGIQKYMQDMIDQCKKQGYVSTIFGRKCYVADINNKNFNLRSFAERAAINAPLQGSAADIIKKAMVMLPEQVKQYLVLQIHDELLFEVPKSQIDYVSQTVKLAMENACKLDIPLTAQLKIGPNWLDLK